MKEIRVKFCDFNCTNQNDYGTYSYYLYNILKKYYKVIISDQPDYIFYNEATTEYLKYDCVRIMYTGENVSPNFNFCDYAIAFDYLNFADRYFRLPFYMVTVFHRDDELLSLADTNPFSRLNMTRDDLARKTDFCSFVYSNYLADDSRKIFFDKLCNYKKVNSGGGYLNNIGGRVSNKLEFEVKHKFSIAFENTSRSGYTTEKIVCSFAAKSIPIYWGNPDIEIEFNEKRFINCHKFKNFDHVIERVKEIDANDDLYLSIVNQPINADGYNFNELEMKLENFIRNIFDQPVDLARRRTVNSVRLRELENNEVFVARYVWFKNLIKKLFAAIYRPLKRIRIVEQFKQRSFKKIKQGK